MREAIIALPYLVADSLEVRDRLDDSHHHAQVGGGRLAHGDDPPTLLVDADLHLVDLVVRARHFLAQPAIALDQRSDSLLQLLLDEAAHLQHAGPYLSRSSLKRREMW